MVASSSNPPTAQKVIFSGIDTSNKYSLWTTDGTAAGTQELTAVPGVAASGLNPSGLTPYNGKLLFSGQNTSGAVAKVVEIG